jgi:hypothetical protein
MDRELRKMCALTTEKAANFNPGGRAIRRISPLRLRLCGFSWPRKAKSHILLAYYPAHRENVGLDELVFRSIQMIHRGIALLDFPAKAGTHFRLGHRPPPV